MGFVTNDPRGYEIICDDSQWKEHIAAAHTIMNKNQAAVKNTIESPDVIYQSNEAPTRDVYFAKPNNTTYSNSLYTKVIVEIYEKDKTGEVVTAFPCPNIRGNIKEDGGLKYVKPKL